MKQIIITITTIAVLSCNNPQNTNQTILKTEDTPTINASTSKIKNDRATIEGFWKLFKKAVLDRDLNALEKLYSPKEHVYTFGEDVYQEFIRNSKVSDIVESVEKNNGEKLYEYVMEFEFEDEIIEGGEEEETPTTTIYIIKNENNEFEIFSVIEAG